MDDFKYMRSDRLDGRDSIFSPYRSQCAHCEFFKQYEDCICVAFPEGIPDDLLEGKSKHDKILKGQVGDYVFTPVVDKEEQE